MTDDVIHPRGGRLTVARSRGIVSGVLLVLLGLWGALIPFVGPYFHFAFSPDKTWHWTAARGWFEVLPGAVAVVGGLLLVVSTNRLLISLGAWLGVAAGGWFVVAPTLAPVMTLGSIHGPVSPGVVKSTLESLTFFTGLGAVIVLVGAIGVGRLSVRSVRDINAAHVSTSREVVGADEAVGSGGAAEAEAERPGYTPYTGPPTSSDNREPVAAEPTAEERGAQEPAAEQPVAPEPVADEPAPQESVADQPVAPEPVADEPAAAPGTEHPPGYGQRVPTYYSGGPAQRPAEAGDETPQRRHDD